MTSFHATNTTPIKNATPLPPSGHSGHSQPVYRASNDLDPLAAAFGVELAAKIRRKGLDLTLIVNGDCRVCGTPLFEPSSPSGCCYEWTMLVHEHIGTGGELSDRVKSCLAELAARAREAEAADEALRREYEASRNPHR